MSGASGADSPLGVDVVPLLHAIAEARGVDRLVLETLGHVAD